MSSTFCLYCSRPDDKHGSPIFKHLQERQEFFRSCYVNLFDNDVSIEGGLTSLGALGWKLQIYTQTRKCVFVRVYFFIDKWYVQYLPFNTKYTDSLFDYLDIPQC